MSKKILAFVLALVLVCSLVPAVSAAETSAKIDFTSTACRTEYSTSIQVWEQNGITVTNEKGDSTSNVGNYSNPARFYKSSTVTIAYPGMTKIEIDCSTKTLDAKYITAWTDTLTAAGYVWTNENKIITITLAEAVDSLTLSPLAAQARAFYITVYADGEVAPTTPTEPEVTEPTETEPPFVAPTTPEEIVNAAYALANGEVLEGTYTLTGVISAVNTSYSTQYKNITVTMVVGEMTDKPIMCYRLKGDGADVIGSGDTITVTGTLKNYNGTIEFDAGCTLDAYVLGDTPEENLTTPEEIVKAAYALEPGTALEKSYTLTGVISSVDSAYSADYGNITVTIIVDDMTEMPIKCYRLKGDGADLIDVGDTITVTGNIKNYNGTVEFDTGCTLDSYILATPEATDPTEPEVTDPTEPEVTDPTEPEVTDPTEPSEPVEPGSSATYVFKDYVIDGELGGGEFTRELDANVTMVISSGWFTAQARIYKNENAVISSKVAMDSIVVNMAANKAGNYTFPVSVSDDGETWTELYAEVAYTGSYADITIELPEGCKYVKIDAPNAQIRMMTMTVNFEIEEVEAVKGDLNDDGVVTNDDVVVLLWHALFPEQYPVNEDVDYNGDGTITNDDVVVLLWHALFPEQYPL